MKKIIIREKGGQGAPALVSIIKNLFPECEVEVCSEPQGLRSSCFTATGFSKGFEEDRPK